MTTKLENAPLSGANLPDDLSKLEIWAGGASWPRDAAGRAGSDRDGECSALERSHGGRVPNERSTTHADPVEVRYRRSDGRFIQTDLATVRSDDLLASRPVREFRWYKGRQYYSGWYWSSTMRQHVVYESRLELARIMLADFDASITRIAAQPFQLTGSDAGRTRRRVPDLMLRGRDGLITIVDVKPAHRLQDPKVADAFAWTERVIGVRGWRYEVWTGAEQQLLENVRVLGGYRRRAVIHEPLLAVALELVAVHRTVGALERALAAHGSAALARPAVLHLLWTRQLRAPLDTPLSVTTRIRRSTEEPA